MFLLKYEVIDSAIITAWDVIMPTEAPLPLENGMTIAKMNTPTNVPLVAAFTNIEISMTPENMPTM